MRMELEELTTQNSPGRDMVRAQVHQLLHLAVSSSGGGCYATPGLLMETMCVAQGKHPGSLSEGFSASL